MGKYINIYSNRNANSANYKNLTEFNGFYTNSYRDPFIAGTAFIFVTKPLLFIDPDRPSPDNAEENLAYMNMTRDPVFTQFLANEALSSEDKEIAKMLSYKINYSKSSFLPIFTNECKSFDPSDVSMEMMEAFDTKQGFRQPLPTHKSASEAANSISIPITEDSNLSFTKMMTLWVNYISNITDGVFDANPDMVRNGVLDYTCSIYYFVLETDGETIKYYCRYTGCWPTSIPFGGLKYSKGSPDQVESDITFQYTIKEDMNPKILEDFNRVSLKLTDAILNEYIIDDRWASVRGSPLLNREQMLSIIPEAAATLQSDERDPIILYKESTSNGAYSDKTKNSFVLLFNKSGYQSEFLNTVLEETDDSSYYYDNTKTDFAKDGWNPQKWWEEKNNN